MDVDYTDLKPHIEKAKDITEFEREGACAICHINLEPAGGLYVICPSAGCESVTHITCLSKHFLKGDAEAVVPIMGSCPSCKAELRWVDVVKELSLRSRGQKEVQKLLRVKKSRNGKSATASEAIVHSDTESDLDAVLSDEELGEIKQLQELNPAKSRGGMGDSWHVIEDSEDSDTGSITSISSQRTMVTPIRASKTVLRTVIEDSDWDDAEVLD